MQSVVFDPAEGLKATMAHGLEVSWERGRVGYPTRSKHQHHRRGRIFERSALLRKRAPLRRRQTSDTALGGNNSPPSPD